MFPGQGYGKQVKGVAGDVSDLLAGALRKAIHKVLDEQGDDLVYDSGCLHSLVGGNVALYKKRLLGWLGPGGAYVLEHWGKRHFLDWRPIGPRRRAQSTIQGIFAPELELLDSEVTDFAAPLPFGPTVRGVGYGFRRRE
jgi:hypothetical protein